METFIEKSSENNIRKVFKALSLLMFMVLPVIQSMAESDALTDAQQKAEHQNFMSYIFMVVGFIAIIAIAWFSVKKKDRSNETNTHHHHPNNHHHHHNVHDKRYGTRHAH